MNLLHYILHSRTEYMLKKEKCGNSYNLSIWSYDSGKMFPAARLLVIGLVSHRKA